MRYDGKNNTRTAGACTPGLRPRRVHGGNRSDTARDTEYLRKNYDVPGQVLYIFHRLRGRQHCVRVLRPLCICYDGFVRDRDIRPRGCRRTSGPGSVVVVVVHADTHTGCARLTEQTVAALYARPRRKKPVPRATPTIHRVRTTRLRRYRAIRLTRTNLRYYIYFFFYNTAKTPKGPARATLRTPALLTISLYTFDI